MGDRVRGGAVIGPGPRIRPGVVIRLGAVIGLGAAFGLGAVSCLFCAGRAAADATPAGLWSQRAGRSITVSPAVGPGRVFTVSTDGRVQCYRLADGVRLWASHLKDSGDAAPAWSPSGTEGRLFVSSGKEGTTLLALSALHGRRKWSRELGSPITVMAADDSVVVALVRKGTLAAWRVGDGAVLWTRALSGWDPPPFLLREGRVFAPMRRDSLLALDARTGTPAWRGEFRGTFACAPVAVAGLLALAEAGGSTVWIEPGTGRLVARSPRSAWQLSAGAACGSELVTVSSGGRAECAGPAPGAGDWSTPLDNAVVGVPLVRRGTVLVGATSGTLCALDAGTGRLLWSFQSAGGFRAGPLAAGDTLILADARGTIHVYLDRAGERTR
jgi:outer membrane protein assembly factor BamB